MLLDPFAEDGEDLSACLTRPLRVYSPEYTQYVDIFAWLKAVQLTKKVDKKLNFDTMTDTDLQQWLIGGHWTTTTGTLNIQRQIIQNGQEYNKNTVLEVVRTFVHPNSISVLTQKYCLTNGYIESFVTTKTSKYGWPVVISRITEGRSRSTTCQSFPCKELSCISQDTWRCLEYNTKVQLVKRFQYEGKIDLENVGTFVAQKCLKNVSKDLQIKYCEKVSQCLTTATCNSFKLEKALKNFCTLYLSMTNDIWPDFPFEEVFNLASMPWFWDPLVAGTEQCNPQYLQGTSKILYYKLHLDQNV